MNALTPFALAAATRGGKTAKALLLAQLNDAANLDFRLQDRSGCHPTYALAIREARFDRARLIDGVKRGPLWRSLRTDEAREHWYSAPAFNAPCVPLAETVYHRGFLVGRIVEAPLRVYLWATRVWRQSVWLAFCPRGERIGWFHSRGEAPGALYRRFLEECQTVEQLWRNDSSRQRFARRGAHDGYELLDDDGEVIADSEPDLCDEEPPPVAPKPLPREKPIAGPSVRRLSRGEERELSAAAKAGDFRARERLAGEALAEAHFVVLRYKQAFRDISYDDFMSAAQPAILRALRTFDPREYRLKTLVDKAVSNELRKYAKRRVKLAKRELLTDFRNYDSYNGAEGDDQNPYDANAADLAWKTTTVDADSLSDLSGLLARLEDGIAKASITTLLAGDVDLTQGEIAKRLGVSGATVSRALVKAYAKLRALAAVPAAADQDAAMLRRIAATRAKYTPLGVSETERREAAEPELDDGYTAQP